MSKINDDKQRSPKIRKNKIRKTLTFSKILDMFVFIESRNTN